MQRAFENLLEKLEEEAYDMEICEEQFDMNSPYFKDVPYKMVKIDDIKKIVNQVASEYGGWIPVSSGKLPEDGVDVLVWFEYFRFGEYNRLFQTTGISYTYNGKWSGFVNGSSGWRELNVIAWQPLPEPYKAESEDE